MSLSITPSPQPNNDIDAHVRFFADEALRLQVSFTIIMRESGSAFGPGKQLFQSGDEGDGSIGLLQGDGQVEIFSLNPDDRVPQALWALYQRFGDTTALGDIDFGAIRPANGALPVVAQLIVDQIVDSLKPKIPPEVKKLAGFFEELNERLHNALHAA